MIETVTENKIFDINKLPAEPGILFFPVSMSRISSGQSAKDCWQHHLIFSPEKVTQPSMGVHILYTDHLYFNSNEPASVLKTKFGNAILSHKNAYLNILEQNKMWIPKAFSFTTWNQLMLETREFAGYYGVLKKMYAQDTLLQKYVLDDIQNYTHEKPTDYHISFILEETLMYYLLTKGHVFINNHFVQGHEKWILWCYPGKPLKSMLYMQQINPFNLSNPHNTYEHAMYDLDERKLYDAMKLDIESLVF